jgi:hypothetical protein
MKPKLSITEIVFRKQLKWLIDYFILKKERNELNPFYQEAYKPIQFVYDVAFNNLQIKDNDKLGIYYYPLVDNFIEADDFFNSEIGTLYIEVMYYFKNYYKK